jgi:hypothetical protein
VDEEFVVVGGVRSAEAVDAGVEEPGVQGTVLEDHLAGVVQRRLQLRPHLLGDLRAGALLRGPAV